MDRPAHLSGVKVQSHHHLSTIIGRSAALFFLCLAALPGFAAQVPLRDGQTVHLKLRNVLTTDNVRKNDVIEFDVAEDVVINGHVVIAKGATAQGKIEDVKGAYKPRAKDAEVIFRFVSIRAVDRQDLPLRARPEKTKKAEEGEVRERSEIPGQIQRIVGADKGKEYDAYIEGSYTIHASDAIVGASAPAPAAPALSPSSAPVATPAVPPTPPSALAATDVTMAPSSVQFGSTPDGAEIVIDGTMVGNTPSSLRLTPGHHSLEIRLAGYRTWSRIMVVDPESHPSVHATLIKQ